MHVVAWRVRVCKTSPLALGWRKNGLLGGHTDQRLHLPLPDLLHLLKNLLRNSVDVLIEDLPCLSTLVLTRLRLHSGVSRCFRVGEGRVEVVELLALLWGAGVGTVDGEEEGGEGGRGERDVWWRSSGEVCEVVRQQIMRWRVWRAPGVSNAVGQNVVLCYNAFAVVQ